MWIPCCSVVYCAGKWQDNGTTARMQDDLRERVRAAAGHSPAPLAAIIDSQSVKGSEMVACADRGYDAGNCVGWLVMPGGMRGWLAGGVGRGNPGLRLLHSRHAQRHPGPRPHRDRARDSADPRPRRHAAPHRGMDRSAGVRSAGTLTRLARSAAARGRRRWS